MKDRFIILGNRYENSLIKQLKINGEREIEKYKDGILPGMGSTYNNPSIQTVYDIVGRIANYALAQELDKKINLIVPTKEGVKDIETIKKYFDKLINNVPDLILAYKNYLKSEKKDSKSLKKEIYKILKKDYGEKITEIGLNDIITDQVITQITNYLEEYHKLFRKEGLEKLFKEGAPFSFYKAPFGDMEIRTSKSIFQNNYGQIPILFVGKNREKIEDIEKKRNIILDFLISNNIMINEKLGKDYDYSFLFDLPYQNLEGILQKELNFTELPVNPIPLGTNFYIYAASKLESGEIKQLGVTNYSNPRKTLEFFKRAKDLYGDKIVVYPNLAVYLEDEGNLIRINDYKLKDLKKGDPITLEKLLNQTEDIVKQTQEILKSKEFYNEFVIPIIIKK
jgi:hypothetical protein